MDILSRYRENHNSSSSDDDSKNSDDECAVWKRAKNKKANEEHLQNNEMNEEPCIVPNEIDKNGKEEVEQPQQLPEQPKSGQKRKRNTIWCDVLQDQLISEDLEDCLLKNKPRRYGSRGKESYDYTRAYTDERRDSESEMSACSLDDDSNDNFKLENKPSFPTRKKIKKFVKLSSAELDAARKINKVLNEKKYYLIQRIVKFAGIEKAMHYLELTKEVEENGGMMIKSNTRRRTPGGVYIQLLKDNKDHVTQEVLDKIFECEMSGQEMKRYFQERKKKNKKRFKYSGKGVSKRMVEACIKSMESDETAPMDAEAIIVETPVASCSDINQPSSPVLDSKTTENISDLEDGEIED